jgi:hypothetical protein
MFIDIAPVTQLLLDGLFATLEATRLRAKEA